MSFSPSNQLSDSSRLVCGGCRGVLGSGGGGVLLLTKPFPGQTGVPHPLSNLITFPVFPRLGSDPLASPWLSLSMPRRKHLPPVLSTFIAHVQKLLHHLVSTAHVSSRGISPPPSSGNPVRAGRAAPGVIFLSALGIWYPQWQSPGVCE